jgi:NAD(P)-dependent dehydrogenase (short-subunit alcohol dehydrogenase family)
VAVITGAGHGFGRATAELFASHGARAIYVADIDGDAAAEVVEAIGAQAIAVEIDVTDGDQLVGLHAQVVHDHDAPDVVVNNVGHYLRIRPFLESTPDHWRALYEINVLHVMRSCRLFLPEMQARGRGAIINVSSVEGTRGYPTAAPARPAAGTRATAAPAAPGPTAPTTPRSRS